MFISKIKSINYEVEEFHIHIVPFQNRDIIPTTLEVEYFTINSEGIKEKVFSTRVSYTNLPIYDAIRLQVLFAGHLFKKIYPKTIRIYIYEAISFLRLTNYLEPRLHSEINSQKQFRFKLRQRLPQKSKLIFYLGKDTKKYLALDESLISKTENKDIIPTDEMLGKNSFDFIENQLKIRKEIGLNANY